VSRFVVTPRPKSATRAALAAAVLSGAPSTAYALATGRDPLEAALAAGAIVVGDGASKPRRLAAAVPVHLAVSFAWTVALDRALPQRHRVLTGAAAGLAIAALDLGVIGRRIPAIAALPLAPQIADHVAFGAIAAPCAARRRGG
jgi:hypothetical protein